MKILLSLLLSSLCVQAQSVTSVTATAWLTITNAMPAVPAWATLQIRRVGPIGVDKYGRFNFYAFDIAQRSNRLDFTFIIDPMVTFHYIPKHDTNEAPSSILSRLHSVILRVEGPVDWQIATGRVQLTLNGTIKKEFPIPAQETHQIIFGSRRHEADSAKPIQPWRLPP